MQRSGDGAPPNEISEFRLSSIPSCTAMDVLERPVSTTSSSRAVSLGSPQARTRFWAGKEHTW